jgi:hypothetical protein
MGSENTSSVICHGFMRHLSRSHASSVTLCAAKWPIPCFICHVTCVICHDWRRLVGSGGMRREGYPQGGLANGVLTSKTVTDDAWSTSLACFICHAACAICHDSVDNCALRAFEEGFGTGPWQAVTNEAWRGTGRSRPECARCSCRHSLTT